ncbi:flagellar motor protein MotB [Mesorhizobium sp. SP-1A]|uniref:flagellar motor protein MotB n=1 Tax=Mesorhizobium sp. SP-1A TaxID=3077840 RepID=UPI0028F6F797|nr:flagellar motor protein MotB [Mesorhizobium sp. SP-1A]
MSEKVIIKKKRHNSHDHAHHGGSWKIAFADFMTAMMALFLLLWLVSITTKEQRQGIANWFNPMAFKETQSASDGMLAGKAVDTEGAQNSPFVKGTAAELESGEPRTISQQEMLEKEEAVKEALEKAKAIEAENEILSEVMDEIQKKMSAAVDMQQLAESVIIEITDEGLRIQITDRDKISMFPVGSTGVSAAATEIIKAIGEAVADVPNNVAITGHTDSLGYKNNASFDNWDLSSGRANSARRILVAAGVNVDRISRVEGLADRDHLVKDEPNDPRNRRISVTLLRKN